MSRPLGQKYMADIAKSCSGEFWHNYGPRRHQIGWSASRRPLKPIIRGFVDVADARFQIAVGRDPEIVGGV